MRCPDGQCGNIRWRTCKSFRPGADRTARQTAGVPPKMQCQRIEFGTHAVQIHRIAIEAMAEGPCDVATHRVRKGLSASVRAGNSRPGQAPAPWGPERAPPAARSPRRTPPDPQPALPPSRTWQTLVPSGRVTPPDARTPPDPASATPPRRPVRHRRTFLARISLPSADLRQCCNRRAIEDSRRIVNRGPIQISVKKT